MNKLDDTMIQKAFEMSYKKRKIEIKYFTLTVTSLIGNLFTAQRRKYSLEQKIQLRGTEKYLYNIDISMTMHSLTVNFGI